MVTGLPWDLNLPNLKKGLQTNRQTNITPSHNYSISKINEQPMLYYYIWGKVITNDNLFRTRNLCIVPKDWMSLPLSFVVRSCLDCPPPFPQDKGAGCAQYNG